MTEALQTDTPAEPRQISPEEQAKHRVGLLVGKIAEYCDGEAVQLEEFLIAMKILLSAQFAVNNKSLLSIWVRQLEAETKARRGMKAREKTFLEKAGKNLPATLAEIQAREAAPETPPETAPPAESHAEDVVS